MEEYIVITAVFLIIVMIIMITWLPRLPNKIIKDKAKGIMDTFTGDIFEE